MNKNVVFAKVVFVRVGGGGGLINMGPRNMFSIAVLSLTHNAVVSAHIVFVCVGGGVRIYPLLARQKKGQEKPKVFLGEKTFRKYTYFFAKKKCSQKKKRPRQKKFAKNGQSLGGAGAGKHGALKVVFPCCFKVNKPTKCLCVCSLM